MKNPSSKITDTVVQSLLKSTISHFILRVDNMVAVGPPGMSEGSSGPCAPTHRPDGVARVGVRTGGPGLVCGARK